MSSKPNKQTYDQEGEDLNKNNPGQGRQQTQQRGQERDDNKQDRGGQDGGQRGGQQQR